MFRNIK